MENKKAELNKAIANLAVAIRKADRLPTAKPIIAKSELKKYTFIDKNRGIMAEVLAVRQY